MIKTIENMQCTSPKVDVFSKYDHVHPMRHLPRPQPSDIIVNMFEHAEHLFYVDVGAHDGIFNSNTLVLEEGYNWSGLCIEPNKILFDKLTKSRNAKCCNVGISTTIDELEFAEIVGYSDALSGFIKFFSNEHKRRIEHELQNTPENFKKITVKSIPLQTLLDENNILNIDYLSIDAECADFEVIKSVNFETTKVRVLSYEAQTGKSNDDVVINKYLEDRGFRLFTACCGDNIYINKDV